jgi:hypothetical protein
MSAAPLHFYPSRDVGTTQRLPSTSILAIDSEDRFASQTEARAAPAVQNPLVRSPYSFTITKNESIMNGFFTRLGLSEVVLPWIVPNINVKTNKMRVRYNVGAGDVDTEIVFVAGSTKMGFYRPAELATAVQTLVRALNPGLNAFTMTYGASNLPNFSYSTNSAATIAFLPYTAAQLNPALPDFYEYDPTKTRQLFDVLGFATSINDQMASGNAGGPTFCQAITYVDVVCLQLTANQALKDTMSQPTARDVLCRIYLTGNDVNNVPASSANFCPPGCAPFTIYRNFSQPKQIQWLPNQPVQSSLRFELYDDMGEPLSESELTPGFNRTNWSFTILVSEN